MTLARTRQEALLRGMATVRQDAVHPSLLNIDAETPDCMVLSYAMAILGDSRPITSVIGDFGRLLESNNITHREVKAPTDLAHSTRAMLIVFVKSDGRPLAVHRLGSQTLAFDPLTKQRHPLEPGLLLKPYAFELYASLPVPLGSLWKLLSFGIGHNVSPLLTVIFSALVVATFNLSIPTLTSYLVGTVLPLGDLRLVLDTSLVVLLIAICTVVSQGFSSLATVRMESLVNLRLEAGVWSHLLRLPLQFFQELGSADLLSRVGAISQMRMLMSRGLLSAGLALLFSFTNLILMFVYQSQLALVAAVFSILSAVVMALLVMQAAKFERPLQEGEARVNDMGLQAVVGMPQVRVSGSEPFVFEQWIREVVKLGGLTRRVDLANDSLEILARVLTPLGQVVVFIVFVVMLDQSKVQSGHAAGSPFMGGNQLVASFVAFQAAYVSFNSQVSGLAVQVANTVAELAVLWQRSRVVMFATPESGYGVAAQRHEVVGQIDLVNLQVRYPDATLPLLSKINLEIPQGGFTAITGASGCGKTTLLRCLLRLIEPDAGVINIDGVDLRQLDVRHYRRQLGVVLQNSPLPTGSIYDVVRAGRPFNHDEIWEALAKASIADDVDQMPMQLETIISEGAMGISGGQRQRLSLARALLGEPKVLLLDEATSALDAPTQAAVTRTLDSLAITRIVIAHRLSTIESADQIAVISCGSISEVGTYSELSGRLGGYLYRNRR